MTNNKIKEILDNAPENATHYLKHEEIGIVYFCQCFESGENLFQNEKDYEWHTFGLGCSVDDLTQSLSDLREILELRDRVADLKATVYRSY